MKKVAALLLAGAFLVTAGALASDVAGERAATLADQSASAQEMTVHGKIVALDATKKSVTVKGDEGELVLRTETATRISRGENVLVWNDLKVGEEVTVTYREQGSERIAVRITLGAR
ncbi:MAG: hypothetical protein F9K18_04850 [Thermoanaerobaculia bacterium]|nr:MAG: hypothetical protein F9K18_04850 [Thermoanaerobaculia bacterium]